MMLMRKRREKKGDKTVKEKYELRKKKGKTKQRSNICFRNEKAVKYHV